MGLAAWRVYGLSRESDGGLAVSVDGVNQALAADTVGTGDTLSSTMQTRISNLGDFASDGFGSLGMTNLILIWDGMDLPAALILEYSRLMLAGVPFWAEDRRVLVPMTATSGLPTLSASTFKPGTLTRTGWTARITAS